MHKICEISLRWILNVRMNRTFHKYKMNLIQNLDGHTTHSMMWTITQCKQIDRIGFEEWLRSGDAQGYRYHLKQQMGVSAEELR